MLRSVKSMRGYRVVATDGDAGHAHDLYFDDSTWKVRYLVVAVGPRLLGRGVLIPPAAIGHPDLHARTIPIARTREQVAHAPPIDADRPVARQREVELFRSYGWPQFWVGAGLWGAWAYPAPLFTAPPPVPCDPSDQGARASVPHDEGDPHLRSAREIMGYRIRARDGELGHVDDFVLDDTDWSLRFLAVDTASVWSGQRVLISPELVREIRWDDKCVCVDVTRVEIANATPWDPHAPVNREYEEHVYDYYGHEVSQHHGKR